MFNPTRILVPTDFSGTAEKAFQDAVDIAKRTNASLYLLHVNEVVQQCAVDYCLDAAMVEQIETKTITASKNMLQKIVDKFPKAKGLKIQVDVKKGNPYEEILKAQEAKKIDLIVMASHKGKKFFGKLMGSVAEKVTRSAKCPVLVVKK